MGTHRRSRSRSRSPPTRRKHKTSRYRDDRDRSNERKYIKREIDRDYRHTTTYSKEKTSSQSLTNTIIASNAELVETVVHQEQQQQQEQQPSSSPPSLPIMDHSIIIHTIQQSPMEGGPNLTEDMNEELMRKMLGFTSFDSTKGKHVSGTDQSAVYIRKERQYRQYMNRKGGFNRALDKSSS
jgi:U4/U6.U5 tri-snRNP-associated protein 3